MAERGTPVSDELEERDSVVLAEMVRNIQIRMISMEREVQQRRSVSSATKANVEDATAAKKKLVIWPVDQVMGFGGE